MGNIITPLLRLSVVFAILSMMAPSAYALVLEVGPGRPYAQPNEAAAVAFPGDTILIYPSTYRGTFFITDLHGTPDEWITFIGLDRDAVIFEGGTEGLHFSDVSYIRIEKLTFTGQTGNGMNIDDAGTFETPSHHVIIRDCAFRDMGATGNNDFLKLSGLDSFEVSHCYFENGAAGGSGIDMVGCHDGYLHHNTFRSLGSNCIQAKGGTQYLRIWHNWFEDGGQRSVNLGGSTGLPFFRPQDAPFEAADIQVYGNVFIRSWAPVAYVGCVRVDVSSNTIYHPQNWIIRILQESVDPDRFLPCGDNSFRNNIIYYTNSLSRHVNVGSNTDPESFLFTHNLWYNESNPGSSTPVLPVGESAGISGEDPLFADGGAEDFHLTAGSPAIGSGISLPGFEYDPEDQPYGDPPPRGAYAYQTGTAVRSLLFAAKELRITPNPAQGVFGIDVTDTGLPGRTYTVRIYNPDGRLLRSIVYMPGQLIDAGEYPAGTYAVQLWLDGELAGLSMLVMVDR